MDTAAFQAWLDRYVAAWRSNDRADIEALFSPDATEGPSTWGGTAFASSNQLRRAVHVTAP